MSAELQRTMQERDAFLITVKRSRATEKSRFVLEACAGATVLDVGCMAHSADVALAVGSRWLHAQIASVADSAVGLDFVESDVSKMNQLGYTIVAGDAERFHLDERFDVVVATDVLEHLASQRLFLERVEEHLGSGGRLVITTPNPFSLGQIAHVLVRRGPAVNPEHRLDPVLIFRAPGAVRVPDRPIRLAQDAKDTTAAGTRSTSSGRQCSGGVPTFTGTMASWPRWVEARQR